MHAKLASIWLARWSVFVKVMARGVDLHLHARVNAFSVTIATGYNTNFLSTQLLCAPL